MRRRRDRGASDALGLVLIAPVMIGLAVLVIGLGRMVDSRAAVRSAAESAAQAGALERHADAQRQRANEVADQMIAAWELCASHQVGVARTSHAGTGGDPDTLSVTVSCTTTRHGIAQLFSSRTHSVTVTVTLDPYRSSA